MKLTPIVCIDIVSGEHYWFVLVYSGDCALGVGTPAYIDLCLPDL